MNYLLNTFSNQFEPLEIIRGEGVYLVTKNEDRILDFSSGITAHSILGYSQRPVIDAIKNQVEKICHLDYKNFKDGIREELAELLVSKSSHELKRVYFVGSSGAEACEAAMKLSHVYHVKRGKTKKNNFISREQSYHGSTSDALSLGDRPNLRIFESFHPNHRHKIQEHNQYRQMLSGETLEEYGERSAKLLEKKINELGADNVAAFIAETTMGGLVGDVPPAPNYWKEIRKICDRYDVHLIIDEVWCGTGTSGKIYSIDHDGVTPDFIFMGKTLGAGYAPVSCVVLSQQICETIKSNGDSVPHSTTHQGHTLSMAAALAVQKIIHNQALLDNVTLLSNRIVKNIERGLANSKFFFNIRGRGLRLSIEYRCENDHKFGVYVSNTLRLNHAILLSGKWHRLTLSPPLIISKEEVDYVTTAICEVFLEAEKRWNELKNADLGNLSFF